MNELLTHYNNLIAILQKMTNSQLWDLGISNKQLGLAIQEIESLKIQIEANLKLASKMAEEIASFERIRKRTRTVSYIELGIGIPCFIIGFLPIWTKEQQNIKNLFLGVGGTAITTGAATFIVTVRF